MDNILTRKLFKNNYLKSINKSISNFKEGGLASLRVKKYSLGGNVTGFSPEEKQSLILGSLAVPLLEGKQAPGQSMGSAFLSNLGAGGAQAINTALQAKKLDIEAGSKNVPALTTVIDTTTNQTVKVPDQIVYSDYLESQQTGKAPRYQGTEGFIPQMVAATSAKLDIENQKKSQEVAKDNLLKAHSTASLINELTNNIAKSDTFTGKLNDVYLGYQSVKGSVDQIIQEDKNKYGGLADQNLSDIKQAVEKYKPSADQQTKTMLTELTYSLARANAGTGRLNMAEINSAMHQIGESGDKATFITGLQQTAKGVLQPAITNYQVAFSDPSKNQYLTDTDMSKLQGTPFANVIKYRDQANDFLYPQSRTTATKAQEGAKKNIYSDPLSPVNLGLK